MNNTSPRQIFSVSELNENIKHFLEKKFSMIWIRAEISNLRIPASGHAYCTLKDEKAQLSAVIFRGQLRQLKFELEDGMGIVGLGRISIYEPRGIYQIILEYVEPKGFGALQFAFEKLKSKLHQEGLFDVSKKIRLPYLPRAISVITSPTGAVLHDIFHIINRRFSGIPIDVWPVRVQGEDAVIEISHAIEMVNRCSRTDVIILARGGGSLEDLAAFNSETVARSIFKSAIPVVSAVGHETDITIADLVADVRAPTPSAAAEIVVPVRDELRMRCDELQRRCIGCMQSMLEKYGHELIKLKSRLAHPSRIIQDFQFRTDEYTIRLNRAVRLLIHLLRGRVYRLHSGLLLENPNKSIPIYLSKVSNKKEILIGIMRKHIITSKIRIISAMGRLDALSPLAVLKRGYSIVRTLPGQQVVTRAHDVNAGDNLEVLLSEGKIIVIAEKHYSE